MTLTADIKLRRGSFTLDAQFEARAGEPLALIGPNGSGKSTIASAIAGVLPIDDGTIECEGVTFDNGRRRLPPQRRNVGVVFQDRLLFPAMTVRDNVAFGLRARGQSKQSASANASMWLDRLDLTPLAERRPDQLSGGQAQRVALARALAIEPGILILDEPLAALDPESKPEVRRCIAAALDDFAGVTLCITHDPVEARTLALRIAVIEEGAITQIGAADDLQRTPRSAFAASFVGINLFEGALSLHSEKPAILGARRVGDTDTAPTAEIRIATTKLPDSAQVFAALHPRAVILSHDRPSTSARNAFRCDVASIDPIEGALRVALTGALAMTAEITDEAKRELNLAVGASIWASFKATEVAVYRR